MRSSFRLPVWLLPLIPVLLPGAALIAGHNYSENAAATTVQIGACASRTERSSRRSAWRAISTATHG
jgi:hypothetical protein